MVEVCTYIRNHNSETGLVPSPASEKCVGWSGAVIAHAQKGSRMRASRSCRMTFVNTRARVCMTLPDYRVLCSTSAVLWCRRENKYYWWSFPASRIHRHWYHYTLWIYTVMLIMLYYTSIVYILLHAFILYKYYATCTSVMLYYSSLAINCMVFWLAQAHTGPEALPFDLPFDCHII